MLMPFHILFTTSCSESSSLSNDHWKCELLSGVQLFVTLDFSPEKPRFLCPWNSPGKNTGVGCHSFSRVSSQYRDWTQDSCIAGGFFTIWATKEAQWSILFSGIMLILITGVCSLHCLSLTLLLYFCLCVPAYWPSKDLYFVLVKQGMSMVHAVCGDPETMLNTSIWTLLLAVLDHHPMGLACASLPGRVLSRKLSRPSYGSRLPINLSGIFRKVRHTVLSASPITVSFPVLIIF